MKKVIFIGCQGVDSSENRIIEAISGLNKNKNIEVVVIDNSKMTKVDEIIKSKNIELKAPELLPIEPDVEEKYSNRRKKWQSPYKFHK